MAPCQTAITGSASFLEYTSGTILGLAGVTPASSTQAATTTADLNSPTVSVDPVPASVASTASPATILTATAPTATLPASVSTTASDPSQAPHQAPKTATAIGAGIGVPLGIAVVGVLGLLFWRELRRKDTTRPSRLDLANTSSGFRSSQISGGQGSPREVPDSQIPWELDYRAEMTELPAARSGTR